MISLAQEQPWLHTSYHAELRRFDTNMKYEPPQVIGAKGLLKFTVHTCLLIALGYLVL